MSKVTIPDKHYVGAAMRSGSKMPLGFITPWGEDDAAKKRMATVDSWCSAHRSGSLPTTVIENTPMLGFRMGSGIRRGDYGAADKWRIEDPRGFELEISSTNLAMLLEDTTVEKGEILDQCVWARSGGTNVLLSVGSEEYQEAVRMTKISNSVASWRDVKIGNRVVLQNGIEGQYLGKMHSVEERYTKYEAAVENTLALGKTPVAVIVVDNVQPSHPGDKTRSELHLIGSPKLSSIEDDAEISRTEAERIANSSLSDQTCRVMSSYRNVMLLASSKIKAWNLSLEDTDDIPDPWERDYTCRRRVLVRLNDGRVGYPIMNHRGGHHVNLIRSDLINQGIFAYSMITKKSTNRYHGSVPNMERELIQVDPADVTSVMLLNIEVTTPDGHVIIRSI